jgi:hypothetical protein
LGSNASTKELLASLFTLSCVSGIWEDIAPKEMNAILSIPLLTGIALSSTTLLTTLQLIASWIILDMLRKASLSILMPSPLFRLIPTNIGRLHAKSLSILYEHDFYET